MEKKYKTEPEGDMLRIIALKDFSDVKVGDKGGLIEKEENLSQEGNCWVYEDAKVYGDAHVSGNAVVYDNAKVYGKAEIFRDARVYDCAYVSDNARVSGIARICGSARVFENARVFGNARVYNDAKISGEAKVYGDARVCGKAEIFGEARVFENAEVSSRVKIFGNAYISGFSKISGMVKVYENARICGSALIHGAYVDPEYILNDDFSNIEPCGGIEICGNAKIWAPSVTSVIVAGVCFTIKDNKDYILIINRSYFYISSSNAEYTPLSPTDSITEENYIKNIKTIRQLYGKEV